MSALDTVSELVDAFYRTCGTVSDDDALVENGEAVDAVAYVHLTRAIRAAQRSMIDMGLTDWWRKRSAAITSWSGADSTDGGRYVALSSTASDFLRLFQRKVQGQARRCGALVEAGGDSWGWEIHADEEEVKGDYYYLKGAQLWLARTASPPSTLYLSYYYQHPVISAATASFDFPTDAMHLVLWSAVNAAKGEAWFPLGPDGDAKIREGLKLAEVEAKKVARQTRTPREWGRPIRYGTRW